MEFRIIETYRNHNFKDYLKQLIANIFLVLIAIIIVPTILIVNLFKKKEKGKNEENVIQENEWFEFMKSEKLIF